MAHESAYFKLGRTDGRHDAKALKKGLDALFPWRKILHLRNSYKSVTIILSSRGNYLKEVMHMICNNGGNYDCSSLWQMLCQYLGIGC